MKTTLKTFLIAAGATALITACAPHTAGDGRAEAGSGIDGGSFGNATMNNKMIQTGRLQHAVALAGRFAAEAPDTINFGFDSAQLDDEARRVLDEQARWIRQFPEVRFRVFGHTDLVGSDAYNRALGLRRAQAAVNHLVSRGVDRARLEALSSLGETRPLIQTGERERRNRRTVTEVSGFVQDQSGILNGRYARVVHDGYVESAAAKTVLTNTLSQDTPE